MSVTMTDTTNNSRYIIHYSTVSEWINTHSHNTHSHNTHSHNTHSHNTRTHTYTHARTHTHT